MPKRRKSKFTAFFKKIFGASTYQKGLRKRSTIRKRDRVLHSKATLGVKKSKLSLSKYIKNPILAPIEKHSWESYQAFNPAALVEDGRVHLLYRALGEDGVSRLGYASSSDGINFDERSPDPAFVFFQHPKGRLIAHYDSDYVSGGGWRGSEDPRITKMGNMAHIIFIH